MRLSQYSRSWDTAQGGNADGPGATVIGGRTYQQQKLFYDRNFYLHIGSRVGSHSLKEKANGKAPRPPTLRDCEYCDEMARHFYISASNVLRRKVNDRAHAGAPGLKSGSKGVWDAGGIFLMLILRRKRCSQTEHHQTCNSTAVALALCAIAPANDVTARPKHPPARRMRRRAFIATLADAATLPRPPSA